jgi:hypothetical protein
MAHMGSASTGCGWKRSTRGPASSNPRDGAREARRLMDRHDAEKHRRGQWDRDAEEDRPHLSDHEPRECTDTYSSMRRSRSALAMTDTELNVIAALAMIGDCRVWKTGYSTPAARGTPRAL